MQKPLLNEVHFIHKKKLIQQIFDAPETLKSSAKKHQAFHLVFL